MKIVNIPGVQHEGETYDQMRARDRQIAQIDGAAGGMSIIWCERDEIRLPLEVCVCRLCALRASCDDYQQTSRTEIDKAVDAAHMHARPVSLQMTLTDGGTAR